MSTHWYSFNWIDYLIIGVVLLSLLIGVIRGFICELISLITWIVALLLAFKFAHPLANHLSSWIDSATARYFVAFAIIFIVILIIGITINVLIRTMVWHRTGVPFTDRLLGLVFGFARGILIIALVLLFVQVSVLKNEPEVKESQLIPQFKGLVGWLRRVLPEKIVNISYWIEKDEQPQPVSKIPSNQKNI